VLFRSRVPFIQQLVSGIDIFGALVLNYPVGGLNPFAVEAAIRFGARIVWLPTGDARHHISYFSSASGVDPMSKNASLPEFRRRATGISVLDDDGKLVPQVYDILDLIAEADICLSLGHLSISEMQTLAPEAVKRGIKKIVIDHPNLYFTKMPLEIQQEMVNMGITMVYCFAEFSPNFYSISPRDMAGQIKKLGADNVVMASDTGQASNTPPAEAIRIMVQLMLENGITPEQIEKMIKSNPTRLIYK
jgi:hypothetical protein